MIILAVTAGRLGGHSLEGVGFGEVLAAGQVLLEVGWGRGLVVVRVDVHLNKFVLIL